MSPVSSLPHPITGAGFPSPVPPGRGWPEDAARPRIRRARDAEQAAALAASTQELGQVDARSSVCAARVRPFVWLQDAAAVLRRSYADQRFYGSTVSGV